MLLFCLLPLRADVPVTADIDATEITLGQVVTLQLVIHDPALNNINFPKENPDYQVVASSTGTSIQIINGVKTQDRTCTLVIKPKHAGSITLPAVEFTDSTNARVIKAGPIEIKVNPLKPSTQNTLNTIGNAIQQDINSDKIFARAVISNPSPFVNEQVRLRLKVYHRGNLKSMMIPPPQLKDFIFYGDEQPSSYKETYNNKEYIVYEITYAIFPLKSGPVDIPGFKIDAVAFEAVKQIDPLNMFGNMVVEKDIKLLTDKVHLSVRSLPNPAPKGFSGYVGDLSITNTLSSLRSITAGDSVTLTSKFSGNGNFDVLNYERVEDSSLYSFFQDKRVLRRDVSKGYITSVATTKTAVIPNKAGKFLIKAIPLIVFNPKTQKYQAVGMKVFELDVLPSSKDLQSPTNPFEKKPSKQFEKEILDYPVKQIQSYKAFELNPDFLIWIILVLNILFFGFKFRSKIQFRSTKNLPKSGFRYYCSQIKASESVEQLVVLLKEYANQSNFDLQSNELIRGFLKATELIIYAKQEVSSLRFVELQNQSLEILKQIKTESKNGSK